MTWKIFTYTTNHKSWPIPAPGWSEAAISWGNYVCLPRILLQAHLMLQQQKVENGTEFPALW